MFQHTLSNGLVFYAREETSDANSAIACAQQDEYRLRDYDLRDRLVFDIGSHVGGVAVLAASLGAHVVAVEPVPENFDLVRANFALNKLPGVVLHGAVGTDTVAYGWTGEGLWGVETGAVHTFVGNSGYGLKREGYGHAHEVKVEQFTLTGLVAEYGPPYLVKLDCEGGEWSALAEPVVADIEIIVGEHHPWEGASIDATEEFPDCHARIRALLEPTHVVTFPDGIEADSAGHFLAVRR